MREIHDKTANNKTEATLSENPAGHPELHKWRLNFMNNKITGEPENKPVVTVQTFHLASVLHCLSVFDYFI